jgi:hypothetical protein
MKGLRFPSGVLAALFLTLPAVSWAQTPDDPSDGPGAPTSSPGPATTPPPAQTPTTAPTAAPTAAPAATPAAPTNAGASYTVRLHDLERRVNELKEQIFRSKARLNLLKETVLHGVIAGSRAVIMHRNEMGSTYTLVKLVYALDGAEIFAKTDDSGHIADSNEFEIFNGSIVPGNHTLSVLMVYQGNGFGVFSYLKGYKFNVRGSHTFAAGEGKQTQLKVVGFEKGNPITTDPKDRPALDFRVNIVADKQTVATPEAKKQ